MKAIAYHIDPKDKELLILANYKKHDITVISNSLATDTIGFAAGKEALIVFNDDPIESSIIEGLKALGVKYIVSSSLDCRNIDLIAVKMAGLEFACIPFDGTWDLERMQLVIAAIDKWAVKK